MPDAPSDSQIRPALGPIKPPTPARRPFALREAVDAIIRLSVEALPTGDLITQALELLVGLPGGPLGPGARLYLVEGPEAEGMLHLAASVGPPGAARPAARLRALAGECLCGAPAGDHLPPRPRCDLPAGSPVVPEPTPGRLCLPLWYRGRRLGVLVLDLPPGPAPSPEAQRLLGSAAAVLAGTIDRGRAEEALRRVKDRFDLAIRGTDAGIWDWDLATGAVYFSARWKSQLGFAEDEISPHFDEWERRLHPDDRDRALSVVRAYLEGRSPEFELEHRLRHKDGSYRWILARGAASRDDRGRITRMVGCHLDITQRKRDQALHLARESRLVAARDLLAGLMPRAPLRVPGLEIHGASVAADYAQGDCFDYFGHPDGSIQALIADASGHGIDSALMMASLHARVRAYAETGLGLGPLLDRANTALVEHMSSDRFITLLMLRIDPVSRSLRYVNAGHPPGYILDACGRVRHELPATGIPLSITPDAGYPPSPPVLFEPGDLIVLVTDGLAETLSPSGEQFGTARVLETVRSSLDQPCPEILSRLLSAAKSFSRSSEATDDLTAVVARVLAD